MDRGARLVSLSFSKYNPSTSSAGGKKSCIEHQGTLLVNSAMIICKLTDVTLEDEDISFVQSSKCQQWSKLFTALTVSNSCQRFVSTIAIIPGCVRWFKCWGWVGSLVEILNLKISSQSVRCITLWRRVLKRFFFFQFWNSISIPSQVGLLPQIVFLSNYAMLWVSLDSKRRFPLSVDLKVVSDCTKGLAELFLPM